MGNEKSERGKNVARQKRNEKCGKKKKKNVKEQNALISRIVSLIMETRRIHFVAQSAESTT